MFRASMPEAAIHEYGHPLGLENEIRPAGQMPMAAPSGDVGSTKERRQLNLGIPIALRPNPCHDFGALLLRKDVCHAPNCIIANAESPVPMRDSTLRWRRRFGGL